MKSANMFGRPGRIAQDPHFIIRFKGETWGAFWIDDGTLLDGLAYENGVTLAEYDNWMRKNADETVVIEAHGKVYEHKLRDFPAVKKLLS